MLLLNFWKVDFSPLFISITPLLLSPHWLLSLIVSTDQAIGFKFWCEALIFNHLISNSKYAYLLTLSSNFRSWNSTWIIIALRGQSIAGLFRLY